MEGYVPREEEKKLEKRSEVGLPNEESMFSKLHPAVRCIFLEVGFEPRDFIY